MTHGADPPTGAELRRLTRRVTDAWTGTATAGLAAAALAVLGELSLAVAVLGGAVAGAVVAVRARRRRAVLIRELLLARRYRELTALSERRVSMRERHGLARTLRRAAADGTPAGRAPGPRARRLLAIADALDDERRPVGAETMVLARRLLTASRESALAARAEPGSELDALLGGIEGALDEAA